MLQRGHSGDGCDLASTLCMHDFRKGGLFVPGNMIVSSCRCFKFVSCVHTVAVLNAASCMNCSLLSWSKM